ncbi:Cysteine/Histidine-rich C1 domain family protein [Quillaja saponaria]|uniref:Cysteine/Histidine-rich C1 domain family protein n=1 Tax=Quillaja saponaria TaxID=32244 RepID=A0AAD7KUS7_QUISA|nr:Cysteine/Histidine-rich C1 domain family protein [Quillaja saponaria]
METDHDSCHEHPLFLSDELHEESCSNCMNTIKDEQAFVCHDCMYYLHKSCFGEPLVIKHFYHPHPLAHINRTAFWCGSCHKFFEFHQCLYCELCDFTMDVRCALLLNNIESEDQSDAHDKNIDVIQHFSHQHPLKSIQITDPDAEVTCFVCCTICLQEQSLYGCISCECSAHESCARLPTEMAHPFHPPHLLSLLPRYHLFLCSCCFSLEYTFHFHCNDCSFHICLECSSQKPKIEVPLTINLPCHPQCSLNLRKPSIFWCESCCKCIQNDWSFSCEACDFHMDIFCAVTPGHQKVIHNIQHSEHEHPLRLTEKSDNSGTHAFRFQCKECSFNLCIKCSFLKPKIRYESHHHLLCFIERFDKSLRCDACETFTKAYNLLDDDYIATQHCVFRCVQCDFNLHLLCGPLPCKIEHEDHGHPLTYMDTVVEDDSGDYYCSLCQEERDPRSQVYYCADCKYIADLTCVIFEVLNILRGDCKDVHFRALGEPEIMVQDSAATSNAKAEVQIKALDSLTLRGIMNTLSEEDEKRLKEFLAHPREVPHELGMSDEISPYTEKNFNQLKEGFFPAI